MVTSLAILNACLTCVALSEALHIATSKAAGVPFTPFEVFDMRNYAHTERDCWWRCQNDDRCARFEYDANELLCKMFAQVEKYSPCPRSLWWMHVPKAGVSFGHSAELCPSIHSNPGDFPHSPLPLNISDEELSSVVSIFRQPDQRLASSFAYMLAMGKAPVKWGFQSYPREFDDVYTLIEQGKTPANDAMMGRNFTACQTNMLIGHFCMRGASQEEITETDMRLAKTRVDKMFFAGVQEKWALSVCLFNYLITGKRFVSKGQLEVCNQTPGKTSSKYDTSQYPVDHADEELYKYVSLRFEKDLRQYDITQQTCAWQEDGSPVDMEVEW